MPKRISFLANDDVCGIIENIIEAEGCTQTAAVEDLILNCKIVILPNAKKIINLLTEIRILLSDRNIDSVTLNRIIDGGDNIWRLLNSAIECTVRSTD